MLFKFVLLCYFGDLCLARAVFLKQRLDSPKSREKRARLATWKPTNHPPGRTLGPKNRIFPQKFMVREGTVFQQRLG